jgi:hypothetical protein
MFDVLIEANANEFISNTLLNANSLIRGRRPLAHPFENESASAAARSFNILNNLQAAESEVIRLARPGFPEGRERRSESLISRAPIEEGCGKAGTALALER